MIEQISRGRMGDRMDFRRTLSRRVPMLIGTAAAVALVVKYAQAPFAWLGLLLALLAFVIAARLTAWRQTVCLGLASACLAIGASELLVSFRVPPAATIQSDINHIVPDGLLGWRNAPGVTTRSSKFLAGEKVYSVRYTINERGWRISPPDRGKDAQGCAIFFADSFTFGEGVEDREAYPYRVGVRTGGRFRIANLAVNGHGPHHMLAQLERDDLAGELPCSPTHIFYLALPHHILRVAAKAIPGGPQYAVAENGGVKRAAKASPDAQSMRWSDRLARLPGAGRVQALLQRSAVLKLLLERNNSATASDLRLYFAVVKGAAEVAARRWPQAERHILAWNIHETYAGGFERFQIGLKATGWRIHDIVKALPGYASNPVRHGLHRFDLHPNATAHDLVARYVVEEILERTPEERN